MATEVQPLDMRWRLIREGLQQRKRRSWLIIAALAIGATIVCAMSMVYFDIDRKMSAELRTFGANISIGSEDGTPLSLSDYRTAISDIPPELLRAGSPFLYGVVRSEQEPVAMVGVDFPALPPLVPYWQISGQWISVPFDDRNVMLGKSLATQLELDIGDSITLIRGKRQQSFNVKGIIESGEAEDNVVLVNLAVAEDWLDKPDQITYALLSMDNRDDSVATYIARLRSAYPQWTVNPIRKVSAAEGQVLDKIRGLMGLISVVILILTTLCVNTSLIAMVNERRREFALQKALGASNRHIITQLAIETILLLAVSLLIAAGLGWLLAQLLGQVVFHAAIGWRISVIPITIGLSLLAAFIALIVPLRRVMALNPALVLKGE